MIIHKCVTTFSWEREALVTGMEMDIVYLDERYKNIIDWTSGTVAFCGRLPPILQCNPAKSAAIPCA